MFQSTLRSLLLVLTVFMADRISAQETCPDFAWDHIIAEGPQSYEIIGGTTSPLGHTIAEIHFGELKGFYGKLYMFLEIEGECVLRVVSAGSYASTANFDAEMHPEKTTRLYHLDLYQGDMHSTLGFFDGPPALSVVKEAADDVFKTPLSQEDTQ